MLSSLTFVCVISVSECIAIDCPQPIQPPVHVEAPFAISKDVEDIMVKEWRDKPTLWVQKEFDNQVIRRNVVLNTTKLSSRVMKAFSVSGRINQVGYAQRVWDFILSPQHNVKPNHLMYSQMLMVYRNALIFQFEASRMNSNVTAQDIYHRSKWITEHAVSVVAEWTHQYKSDQISLKGHLATLNIHSPVILNQMIRLLLDRENTFCWQHRPWMLKTIRFYVRKCLELEIEPDQKMKDMLVKLIRRAPSLEEVRFVVDEMVIPAVGKENFLLFDAINEHRIINRILALGHFGIRCVGKREIDALLYAFQLRFLNHPQIVNRTA